MSQPGYLVRWLYAADRLRALHRTPSAEVVGLSRHEFVLCIRSRSGHPGRSLFRSRGSRGWRSRTRGRLLDFLWPSWSRGIRCRRRCRRRGDQWEDFVSFLLFPVVGAFPFSQGGFAGLPRWRDEFCFLLSSGNVLARGHRRQLSSENCRGSGGRRRSLVHLFVLGRGSSGGNNLRGGSGSSKGGDLLRLELLHLIYCGPLRPF